MSQKLEHIFKESLSNQEVPYDPKAWDKLSASLDKTMPVSPKRFFTPWAAAMLVIGIIGGISALYYFSGNYDQSKHGTTISKNGSPLNTDNKNSKGSNSFKKSSALNSDAPQINQDVENTEQTDKVAASKKITNVLHIDELPKNTLPSLEDKSNLVEIPNPRGYAPTLPSKSEGLNFELATIEEHCQNSSESISNLSDVPMIIESPSGAQFIINPKNTKTIELKEAGTYMVFNRKKSSSFNVFENGHSDFTIETEQIFKNGIPTTTVLSNSTASKMEWSSSFGNQVASGTESDFHFFKKGTYSITLKSTNEKGCVSTSEKSVIIHDDYNLLATTGFKPQDLDPRNNTFMPRALKERNTKFTLIILDPNDGGIVYQTTDANAGWNGIDQRNGKSASHGSNYIWKVTLANPIQGENLNYKDVVTVIID